MKSFVKTEANLHTKTDQKMEQCLSMGFKPSMANNFFKAILILRLLSFMKHKCHFPNPHQKLFQISKAQPNTFSYGHPNHFGFTERPRMF